MIACVIVTAGIAGIYFYDRCRLRKENKELQTKLDTIKEVADKLTSVNDVIDAKAVLSSYGVKVTAPKNSKSAKGGTEELLQGLAVAALAGIAGGPAGVVISVAFVAGKWIIEE